MEKLSTPKPAVCSRIKPVFFDFSKNKLNSNELEKIEENKKKPSTRKLKLENWGLREKIRYNKLKTGMEFLKATLKKSETDLHLLKTMK